MSKNTSNTSTGRAPKGKLKDVLSDAKDFCNSTMLELQLEKAIAGISAEIDHLSPDQRKQLQEIGEFMTQGHAAPIKSMARDGTFTLRLSEDRMHLLMDAKPPIAGGKAVVTSDVIQTLREQNIHAGVDVPKIQTILQQVAQGQEHEGVSIVHGSPPTLGIDGSVRIQARNNMGQALREVQVNLDNPDPKQHLLCLEGDCVLIHQPPKQGNPGVDAYGKPLAPLPVSDELVEAGENIVIKDNEYVAKITGMLQFKNRMVEILPILYFSNDVTQMEGPIDFDGQVIVQATVRDGASIKATGDITVQGNVEAASIQSTQGNIVIRQGVVGRGEATLRAKINIHARFVENANLLADENIIIEHGTLRSCLVAGKTIDITKGKGHLIGGSTIAGELIIVRILGATGGQQTDVSVGLSAKAMKLLAKLDEIRQKHTSSLQACRQLIERIHHLVRDPSKMDKSSLESLAKLKQIQLVLEVKTELVDKRKSRVIEAASRTSTGKIQVLQEVYSGVRVKIGKHLYKQLEQARARQFVLDPSGDRILYQPLKV